MNVAAIEVLDYKTRSWLEEDRDEPLILTLAGKPVAVLLGLELEDDEDLERLNLWLSKDFQDLIRRSRDQHSAGMAIEHDRFWDELEKQAEGS